MFFFLLMVVVVVVVFSAWRTETPVADSGAGPSNGIRSSSGTSRPL